MYKLACQEKGLTGYVCFWLFCCVCLLMMIGWWGRPLNRLIL